MHLPPYKPQQEDIINYLYQYRYLLVNHFQKLFGHSDKKRIQEYLTDLVEKKYLAKIVNEEVSKAHVYCLDTRAGHILKKDKDNQKSFLGRLYKEKSKEPPFVKWHLFLCDIFLYFLLKKQKNEELSFFTYQELWRFKYFPEDKPSAYIEIKQGKETERYFLEYFDEVTLPFVARNKVQDYLKYCQGGDWQAAVNVPFPTVIFVVPTEKFKKHIQIYSKAVLDKNLGEEYDLYVITKNQIKTNAIVWKEVKEIKDL